jgi:hypothetical protein
LRRYREQKILECAVKDREYSFRGWNLGDVAGGSLTTLYPYPRQKNNSIRSPIYTGGYGFTPIPIPT